MRETEPPTAPIRANKRYHVAALGTNKTLCGEWINDVVFDEPSYWVTQETSSLYSSSLPKCKVCANHEDLALLFLGDLP